MIPRIDPRSLHLYAITADGAAKDPAARARIREWLQAGVRTIQLREKKLAADDLLSFGRFLRVLCSEYGALFIVNDDPHLATILDADGVHLGWEDMSVKEARRILGPDKIIGVSTHDRTQFRQAQDMEVDYIAIGPVYPSPTKQVGRATLGPEFAGWAARQSPLPVVAIGGITLAGAAELAAHGCRNVAVISALNNSSRPGELARAFLDILKPADSTTAR